jgi:lambda family phage portal protein
MGDVAILDASGVPIRATANNDTAHFGASRTARELRNWTPPIASADKDLLDELRPLVARQRDLVRNHGVATGGIQTLVDNVVGTGFRLQARPDYAALGWSREKSAEWSRKTESLFRTWANTTECDAGRNLNFGSMTGLVFRTGMLAGEALALPMWLNRPGAKWRTCFMLTDPDRLGSPYGYSDDKTRGGIEHNQYGEPTFYHILKKHPNDLMAFSASPDDFERIPARNKFGRLRVIHIHDRERTGQSRGKPIMTPIISNFKMLDHYQRNELKAAVVNSLVAAFVESPMGGEQLMEMFGGDSVTNPGQNYIEQRSQWEAQLQGGAIIPMFPGDKLSSFNPGRPSSAYKDFVETILREIGVSMGLPYELIMKDFSKTTYSSARAALLEAWRFFSGRRKWLTSYWCQPVYEMWLEEAIARGEVEAPDFDTNRALYARCEWIGDGRGWVDPLKEVSAAEKRIQIGVSSLARECAEQGQDWEETLEQRAAEAAKCRELGLPMPWELNQGGAPMQNTKKPDPAEADDESI